MVGNTAGGNFVRITFKMRPQPCYLASLILLLISCALTGVSTGGFDRGFGLKTPGKIYKDFMEVNRGRQPRFTPARNYPGMAGFPQMLEFKILAASLKGSLLTPASEYYKDLALMYNLRVTKFPYAIVLVENIEDVQKVMVFAKQHNLMVTIQSSGHSYIGRSTYDGSIQINFKNLTGRYVVLNSTRSQAGEITVESGNSWMDVYTEVDTISTVVNGTKRGRVIVGGSAHTVAMGGYTQGGGHSPIGRRLGLAVDNLLEATMVTVDGSIVTVSETGTVTKKLDGTITETCDTSLYWAIRGGGGGTWGAIVTFTFKLHFAPERFRTALSSWALKAGDVEDFGRETVKFVLEQVDKLCPQWGGYLLFSGGPLDETGFYKGSLTVYLNHFGSDDDPCTKDVDAMLNYNISGNQYAKDSKSYATFLEYEKTAYDPPVINAYIVNTFVQPENVETESKLMKVTDFMMKLDTSESCTGVLIGGAIQNSKPGSTPVNPAFRSGLLSLTCGIGWEFEFLNDTQYIARALEMGRDLKENGEGVYYNECAEDLDDWKEMFWGSMDTYCKLAAIKRKIDPDNFLWCHNCVGSDFKFGCPASYWWAQDNPSAYRKRMSGSKVSPIEYEMLKALREWV